MSPRDKDVVTVAKDISEREMVIGPKDTEVVKKFFKHFQLEIPEVLEKAMKDFEENPNLRTQKTLVIEVNRAVHTGKSSLDQLDDIFKPVVESAKEVAYILEFSDEVDEMLLIDPEDPQESSEQESEQVADSQEPSGS